MVEKLLEGPKTYYLWLLFLLCLIAGCGIVYLDQLQNGLSVTGMNRDVSWGLYISQFTYFVGVAASAVMLVLPTYFHHYKKFKRMIIFGEFMAVAAVVMCALFIVVDLGQPQRMLNVMLHPTPNSVMFYDMMVLIGYLGLNIIIGWVTLEAERHEIEPPKWIKPLIYLSILWAFSIHTVTAFLYAGVPGRHYWLTAIMAGRFLASAFCSGPAILMLLMLLLRRLTGERMFVYILGRAFMGTALCGFAASVLAQALGQSLPGVGSGLSLVAHWLMAWGDAIVTGMLAAVFVAFKPEWLATWSDNLYLKRPR